MIRQATRSLRAAVPAVVVAGLLITTPAQPLVPANAAAELRSTATAERASDHKVSPQKYSHALARRMNVVRERHDLRPLRVVRCLNRFAAPWARHLARSGRFYHQDLGPIMDDCALSSVGEIIAKGSVTPRRMIGMWLDSPGHRRLLLKPSFRIAGVAGRKGSDGAWVGCIDFGRR